MIKGYDKYVVDKVRRINIRYYLIKVHGKYYIIDYSNPKDIKSYFPGLFPETLTEWKIYDVAILKNQKNLNFSYEVNPKKSINWTIMAFLLYLLNVMFFPEKLNLSNLTYDPIILQRWPQTLGYILASVGIIFLIIFFQKLSINLTGEEKLTLKQAQVNETESKNWFSKLPLRLRWIISMIILIPIFTLVGIAASSYSQLFVFLVVPLYVLFFGKFITFIPGSNKSKYQIIVSEEK